MGSGLSTPVANDPLRNYTRRSETNASGPHVLCGAQGAQFINSSVTAAGRDVNISYNTFSPTSHDHELLYKILEWLSKINFRDIVAENLAKRTPETGRWVLDSDWLTDWLRNLLGGIVWGTGMPGAGKTIIACIVIEYLQKIVEESKDVCLLFAFCRYTEQLMVIDILLAILRQLLERHPQVLSYVNPMYVRHQRENTRPSEAEVVDLLRQIATSGLFKQTFYILDGLDEAASDIQVDLLDIISSLPVNFFITSRPLDSLKDLVPDARFLTIIASDPDIALLIDQKVHRIPTLRRLLLNNATLKAEVVSMIRSKSSGMFLLASLQLDMLKGCASESDVRKAVDGLPQGLNGVYEATMARIKALPGPQADLAKRVLIWVTYAHEPLTPEELVLAVSVCPDTFRYDDKLEPADIDSILSLCCGLVQVETTTNWLDQEKSLVRFVHYSTAEYLVKNFELHYPEDPHAFIASTCISFLRYYGLHDVASHGCDDDEGIWNRIASLQTERTSMANYPYKYWGLHATKSRVAFAPALAFLDDIKQYPLFWHHEVEELCLELPSVTYIELDRLERLQSVHVAAVYGIREYFDRLESEGWTSTASIQANIFNNRDSSGCTPLILAASAGSEDVVLFLLGIDAVDVNLTDEHGQTALFAAVANRQAGVVKAILSSRGVDDVNQVGWKGRTPLALAARKGEPEIVRLLMEVEGVDVNAVDWEGKTALALAARKGRHDIVRVLLQTKGMDLRGALDEALGHGQSDVIKALIQVARVSLDEESPCNSLMRAAQSGESEAVMTVLNHGTFDINAKDDQGRSALAHSFCNPFSSFSTGATGALLQIPGIDINSTDKYGETILMYASRHLGGDVQKLVETIIKLGGPSDICINAKDVYGRTALAHALLSCARAEVVRTLLAAEGFDYNCADAKGQTPLILATKTADADIVAELLGFEGIKIDSRDDTGRTALAYAISRRHDDRVFDTLLKVDSVSADYTTSDGLTFLMLAAASGSAARIRSTLQLAQFDINTRDLSGRTALAHAVDSLSYEAVEALLEVEGVDVQCVDEHGLTLLMRASRSGEPKIVDRFLGLGLGASVNVKDIRGRTALLHAAESHWGGLSVVAILLKVEGIDCSVQDFEGKTALMTAAGAHKKKVVELLNNTCPV